MTPAHRSTIKLILLTAASVLLLPPPPAPAGVVTQSQTVPFTATDFTTNLTFNQFDPSLGTLTAICFTIDGFIESLLFAENEQGNPPDVVTFSVTASLTLRRPDNSPILSLPLSILRIEPLDEGDFFFDIDGDSGSVMSISPPPVSDLALFTGLGTITLPFDAQAINQFMSQTGNSDGFVLTGAGATVTLEYKFDQVVIPEPTSLALVGLGMGLLIVRRTFRPRNPARR